MTRSEVWLKLIQSLPIRTRDRRQAPLIYNMPQMKVWQRVAPKIDKGEPIRAVILKSRREGMSTEIESWLTAFIALEERVNALVMAHTKPATKRIWLMSRLFVTGHPVLSEIGRIDRTGTVIHFGDSALEISTAGSPEAQRSADITALHASEVAFWKHPEALEATLQTIPRNTFSFIILESTANGKIEDGEMFYDEWCRAEAGESTYMPIFLSWLDFEDNVIPGADVEELDAEEEELRDRHGARVAQLAWRREMIADYCKGSLDHFHQEYPTTPDEAFLSSGLAFFHTNHLAWITEHLMDGTPHDITPEGGVSRQPEGATTIFKWPVPGRSYVIGSDCSFGLDTDVTKNQSATRSRSAGQVLDMETMEQMAEYDAGTAPHVQAGHLAGLGRLYNKALVAPEVQAKGGGGGREIIVYLRERYGYWNLHRWRMPDRIQPNQPVLYGWETNARTRPRMLARIREVVLERSAVIHSRHLLRQLRNFGENAAGNLEALAGHDDLLFAWGVALMSRSENYSPAIVQGGVSEQDLGRLGIRFRRHEHPQDRLKRLLALGPLGREKTFLEL